MLRLGMAFHLRTGRRVGSWSVNFFFPVVVLEMASRRLTMGVFGLVAVTFLCVFSLLSLFLGSNGWENFILPPEEKLSFYERVSGECDQGTSELRVYMYDLPPKFHFGLLGWKPESSESGVWPDLFGHIPEYAGGLNLQHSIEYWLTLDLLGSTRRGGGRSSCVVTRVNDSLQADVIFVPFFSSVSFNRYSKVQPPSEISTDHLLQDQLVEFLVAREEWKRSNGHDHIIMAHHPNSLSKARYKLWPCMFVFADFGRYSPRVANVDKDVVAPYKHVVPKFENDSSGFDHRPILVYFKGAIYRKDGGFIRQEIFYLLKDEKDVHFSFGSGTGKEVENASEGMRSSKFCLNIAGDTPSSNRLFDAIVSHCVPVIVSDDIELPFEDVLDYSEFCIFVRSSDAVREGFLLKTLRSINRERWTKMWNKLKEVESYFEFQYPSQEGDAVQHIWQAVARKVPAIRYKLHRSKRFLRYKHQEITPIFDRSPRRHS